MVEVARRHAPSLRSEVYALADLLLVQPHPSRQSLRTHARTALDAAVAAGADGLLPHLLRNLLRDLAGRGDLDGRYYANQLTLAADRLDG